MKVELVSKSVGVNSYSELDLESIVSAVARHGKLKEDKGKLISYLIKNKHWSPLQHIFFSFKIETSRAISAQIFRHRSLNFQETSQRYEKIQEFETIELRQEHPTNRQSSTEWLANINQSSRYISTNGKLNTEQNELACEILHLLEETERIYNKGIELGVAKECMRMLLPMCSKTTIHVSGTLRDLLAFINIRADKHTQKEARDIAIEMGKILEEELPKMFENLEDWQDGLFM